MAYCCDRRRAKALRDGKRRGRPGVAHRLAPPTPDTSPTLMYDSDRVELPFVLCARRRRSASRMAEGHRRVGHALRRLSSFACARSTVRRPPSTTPTDGAATEHYWIGGGRGVPDGNRRRGRPSKRPHRGVRCATSTEQTVMYDTDRRACHWRIAAVGGGRGRSAMATAVAEALSAASTSPRRGRCLQLASMAKADAWQIEIVGRRGGELIETPRGGSRNLRTRRSS